MQDCVFTGNGPSIPAMLSSRHAVKHRHDVMVVYDRMSKENVSKEPGLYHHLSEATSSASGSQFSPIGSDTHHSQSGSDTCHSQSDTRQNGSDTRQNGSDTRQRCSDTRQRCSDTRQTQSDPGNARPKRYNRQRHSDQAMTRSASFSHLLGGSRVETAFVGDDAYTVYYGSHHKTDCRWV